MRHVSATARAQRRHHRFPTSVRVSLGAMVGMGLILRSTLTATEIIRRGFDLPAGDAGVILKQFAAQSGEQLLYSPDDVSGVPTHAVHGQFTPLIALEHMLKGSRLKARQDEKTKAIAITAIPAPRSAPQSIAPAASSSAPQPQKSSGEPRNMKRKNPIAIFAGWLALALTPTSHAQISENATSNAEQPTGAITGRVQNIVTGKYLRNVRITVKGTELVLLR